jgi:hypothetical protein
MLYHMALRPDQSFSASALQKNQAPHFGTEAVAQAGRRKLRAADVVGMIQNMPPSCDSYPTHFLLLSIGTIFSFLHHHHHHHLSAPLRFTTK